MQTKWQVVYISGPMPTLGRGDWRFSRLLSLNTWLQSAVNANDFKFIDNFNLLWNRAAFFKVDGIHPNSLGSQHLAANIVHAVHTSPYWLSAAHALEPSCQGPVAVQQHFDPETSSLYWNSNINTSVILPDQHDISTLISRRKTRPLRRFRTRTLRGLLQIQDISPPPTHVQWSKILLPL